MTAKTKKRSPLKQAPLPQAGDSIHDKLLGLITGDIGSWLIVLSSVYCVAIFQWGAWLKDKPQHPGVVSVAAIILTIMAGIRIRSAVKQAKQLRLGMEGEISVSQRLDSLRAKGYHVFNDIVDKGFNIDHVIIGPGGVFVIDTKTIGKPQGRRATVRYDGERVWVDGHQPDRDPIAQVKACRDRIHDILTSYTDRRTRIRPVVLYADWWVEPQPKGVEVWVLNPSGFLAFVDKEPIALQMDEIAFFSTALDKHIRPSA